MKTSHWRQCKSNIGVWLFLLIFCMSCSDEDEPTPDPMIVDIESRLAMIEDLVLQELDPVDHFTRLFEIHLEQPVDHRNPAEGSFTQKVYLAHVDEELPVVLETEGYARSNHRTRELAQVLNCNQLAVEHRYFGESVPVMNDWRFLDIWQAANDHHRIVEIFKEIYPNSWVSSGRSKGGDAAIFHRRFFPADVQATLAYVAPLMLEQYDQRFQEFYNTAGDESCRERMRQFQRNILLKLDSIPDLFDQYVKSVGDFGDATRFSLSYRDIVYHAIRQDYPFEFWSSETESCSTIPDQNATAQELLDHFVGVFDVFLFFSDYGVNFWTPYGYQALTELGNYAFDTSYLTDLELDIAPLVEYNTSVKFDPAVMQDIQGWIAASASEMVFLYGQDDPWTVAAVDHNGSDRVIKIVNPGTKHGTQLSSLPLADKDLIVEKLKEWMEE